MVGFQPKLRYEVAVHNRKIRHSLYVGEKNRTGFTDDWAQTHYIEVQATSPDEARKSVLRRYPEDKGFVIEGVSCTDPNA